MAIPIGGPVPNGKNTADRIRGFQKRRSVEFTLEFPVSASELWNLISRAGNLNDCHPFCRTNDAISWESESHQDRLVYLNGRTYFRQFLTWDKDIGYELIIGEENGPESYVVWEIRELGDKKSTLTITVYPFLLANMSKITSYLPFMLYIRPKLKSYLKSVLNGFHYFIETGEAVPRNHWGKHSWFS